MRKIHPIVAALAAVTISFAACEQPAEEEVEPEEETAAVDTVDHQAEFQALADDYEAAWSARDWDSVLVLHTEDFEEITPTGEQRTRAEFETSIRDTTQQPPEGSTMSITVASVEVAESGELAYATGTTDVTVPGADGRTVSQQDRWMAGFEKVDGEWRVDRLVVVSPTGDGAMQGDGETPVDGGDAGDGAPEGEDAL